MKPFSSYSTLRVPCIIAPTTVQMIRLGLLFPVPVRALGAGCARGLSGFSLSLGFFQVF